MMVHVKGDPMALAPQLREMAAAVNPMLRLSEFQWLDEVNNPLLWIIGLWIRITVLMRATDAMLAVPRLPLLMIAASVLQPSIPLLVLMIALLAGWNGAPRAGGVPDAPRTRLRRERACVGRRRRTTDRRSPHAECGRRP